MASFEIKFVKVDNSRFLDAKYSLTINFRFLVNLFAISTFRTS
jgi:hypothetical protein